MASNERELARKAKKQKKQQRTKRIIWGVIIAVILLLIGLKVAEIDFSAVKNKFVGSDGKLSVDVNTEQDAYPFALDSSKDIKVVAQNDKLSVLTSVSYTALNPTTGTPLSQFSHGYANPMMKNAGNYVCIFDQGATRLRLDKLNGAVFDIRPETPVLCANVCKTGTIIYATKENNGQSCLYVVNSSKKTLLKYKVSDGYIVSTAIDETGKKIAFATVNSKDAKLVTTVFTMNVSDKKPKKSFDFNDDILDMSFCSNNLYIVGTNSVNVISNLKKQKEVYKKGSVNTVCFNYTSQGELVYIYSKYSSANENFLTHINSSGKIAKTVELKQKPKYVSSVSNEITVLFSDKAAVYSLTKGELKGTYKCDDSVTTVNKLSTKIFVSRHQLIDVIE